MRSPVPGTWALAAAVLAAAAGCDDAPPPATNWPAGTVLALDGVAIDVAEVDEVASWVAMLEPRDSLEQLRRVALTNVVLPRLAARASAPARREEALGWAREWQRALAGGLDPASPTPGPLMVERQGQMLDLGMEVWNEALKLEPGRWSEVIETAGCFHVLRTLRKGAGLAPGRIELAVEICDFPYLPLEDVRGCIERQLDRSHLVFVDESWRGLVPLAWQHRLRGTP